MSPAGSAVMWVVLLSHLSQVVDSIVIPPSKVGWNITDWG